MEEDGDEEMNIVPGGHSISLSLSSHLSSLLLLSSLCNISPHVPNRLLLSCRLLSTLVHMGLLARRG